MGGFTVPFCATAGIMAASMALFQRVAAFSKSAFAVVVCLLFSSTGGIFAMAPPVCNIVFGTASAAQIYSVLFSAFVVASIGGSILTKSILKASGWDTVFATMAAMSSGAIL